MVEIIRTIFGYTTISLFIILFIDRLIGYILNHDNWDDYYGDTIIKGRFRIVISCFFLVSIMIWFMTFIK